MPFCIQCGKEIEEGKTYCDEHNPLNAAADSQPQNAEYQNTPFTGNPVYTQQPAQQFGYQPQSNVYPQNQGYYQSVGYQQNQTFGNMPIQPMMKKKAAPIWIFPVFAAAGIIGYSLIGALSGLITRITGRYAMMSALTSLSAAIMETVFIALAVVSVIVYNKKCEKKDQLPIYAAGCILAARAVGTVVSSVLSAIMHFISGLINSSAYYYASSSSIIAIITGIISFAVTVAGTYFLFAYIMKEKNKKTAENAPSPNPPEESAVQ